jgi:hypothetical protein
VLRRRKPAEGHCSVQNYADLIAEIYCSAPGQHGRVPGHAALVEPVECWHMKRGRHLVIAEATCLSLAKVFYLCMRYNRMTYPGRNALKKPRK